MELDGSLAATRGELIAGTKAASNLTDLRVGIALIVLLCCNVVDAFSTLHFVEQGLATEANPVMNWLLNAGPVAFVSAKLAIVTLGAGVLWRFHAHKLAATGSFVLSAVYALVVCYHALGALAVGPMAAYL